jgi:NAD(P)H-dependent flavin oxidoreductase YrpB (nitropropane dioxygenase family)
VAGLYTPLCRQLGIEYHIFAVGFAESAGPELVAAASEAGGCGVLGGCPPDEIRRRIARVKELTSRPFGVNVIIAALEDPDEEGSHEDTRKRIRSALHERAPILVVFWGDLSPFVEQALANGVKVFVQTGSVEEAKCGTDGGVDAVIAQGTEAGGHVRATESLWEVLPRVVKAGEDTPIRHPGGSEGTLKNGHGMPCA